MSRIDTIGMNGNDGLHYVTQLCFGKYDQMAELSMKERCSGCVTDCKGCKTKPICFGTGSPVDEDGCATTDDVCMECNFLHECADATPALNSGPEFEDGPEFEGRLERSSDNGTSGSHYELPDGCTELKHLIWYKNMNAQVGEAFRKLYRLGEGDRNSVIRDLNGVIAYCQQEIERIERYGQG
jgi:hypothetical protein